MTKLDQFESVFRAADKALYEYYRPQFERVLLVSDLSDNGVGALHEQVRTFVSALETPPEAWAHLGGDRYRSVGELLEHVTKHQPDLILTYRHLHSNAWRWPHGLGEHLDVLTQVTESPVLVLPHPDSNRALPHTLVNTDCVMAITDHLSGDARLINYALGFTARGGTCWLTHVESQVHFERYMEVIAKIPELDTEDARSLIEAQLLKEPYDFIDSCRAAIGGMFLDVVVEEIVIMGRRVAEYVRLIQEHEVDLLVLNTMDGDQLAMHGQAYPLAVELREIPLLML